MEENKAKKMIEKNTENREGFYKAMVSESQEEFKKILKHLKGKEGEFGTYVDISGEQRIKEKVIDGTIEKHFEPYFVKLREHFVENEELSKIQNEIWDRFDLILEDKQDEICCLSKTNKRLEKTNKRLEERFDKVFDDKQDEIRHLNDANARLKGKIDYCEKKRDELSESLKTAINFAQEKVRDADIAEEKREGSKEVLDKAFFDKIEVFKELRKIRKIMNDKGFDIELEEKAEEQKKEKVEEEKKKKKNFEEKEKMEKKKKKEKIKELDDRNEKEEQEYREIEEELRDKGKEVEGKGKEVEGKGKEVEMDCDVQKESVMLEDVTVIPCTCRKVKYKNKGNNFPCVEGRKTSTSLHPCNVEGHPESNPHWQVKDLLKKREKRMEVEDVRRRDNERRLAFNKEMASDSKKRRKGPLKMEKKENKKQKSDESGGEEWEDVEEEVVEKRFAGMDVNVNEEEEEDNWNYTIYKSTNGQTFKVMVKFGRTLKYIGNCVTEKEAKELWRDTVLKRVSKEKWVKYQK